MHPCLLRRVTGTIAASAVPRDPFIACYVISLLNVRICLIFYDYYSAARFIKGQLLLDGHFLYRTSIGFHFPSVVSFTNKPSEA